MGIFSDLNLFHRNPKLSSPKGQTSTNQHLPSLPLPLPLPVGSPRDVVYGLDHLHLTGLTNQDLKSPCVLINFGEPPSAKICDQGIIDGLAAHPKSLGWHSPDLLLGRSQLFESSWEQSEAVDLFNLGCLIFYFITKGGHPFGPDESRDANIENNYHDLTLVEHNYEAADLITQLLQPQPEMRQGTALVIRHPFFWDSKRRALFLWDVSAWLEMTVTGRVVLMQ